MKEGEKRITKYTSRRSLWTINPKLIQQAPREYFQGIQLERGLPLQAQTPEGQIINMVVVDFDENTVTVDLNHPLAGKDLVFEIEVVNVREATQDEILHGHAHGAGGHHY